MIVAYHGHPKSHVWGQITFESWDIARQYVWKNRSCYDLHDTDKKRTAWDEAWESAGKR